MQQVIRGLRWTRKELTIPEELCYVYGSYFEDYLADVDICQQIAAIMDKLRSDLPKEFGELKVVEVRDYDRNKIVNMESGEERETGLPQSNVIYFDLTNDSWCCARPSGTEPKLKFYMGVKGSSLEDAQEKVEKLTEALKAHI